MSDKSIVEERICDREFSYLHPYFYNNPYALRCELGIGDSNEVYMANAIHRATEIYHILFPHGADAIIFNYWVSDYCDTGDAEANSYGADLDIIGSRIKYEMNKLRFLSEYQHKYRHFTVRDLATYDEPDDPDYGVNRRNRVICYSDGIGFDYMDIIQRQVSEIGSHDISFVSFEHECIYSIYDDRGCDIVFMTHDKLKELYHKIEPYFLEYDAEEMRRRLNKLTD